MTPRVPPARLLLVCAGVFLAGCQGRLAPVPPGEATVPAPQPGMEARHAAKAAVARGHAYGLLLIGDSITHNFEKPEYRGSGTPSSRPATPSTSATAAAGPRTSSGISATANWPASTPGWPSS